MDGQTALRKTNRRDGRTDQVIEVLLCTKKSWCKVPLSILSEVYLEWRIELIACGNCGVPNNANGWLPSFIVDFLLLFAGWSALTYLTCFGRCQQHSRCHHAKSFCIHLNWVMIARIILPVSEIHRSTCMCNSTNDRNQSLFSVHYEIQLICFSILVRSIEKAQEFCIEATELWVETVWNRNMQFVDINHFPMSSEVSKCMSQVECASKVSKWMSGRCKQLSGEEEQMARCLARWFHSHHPMRLI